jgi:hypothetical protein
MMFPSVIPGRPKGPGPESITTNQDYGFRARGAKRVEDARARAYGPRPGMTVETGAMPEQLK